MRYGELRTQFLDLLNRTDCTETQADLFITMGLRRLERILRTPLQKVTTTITVDENWTGSIAVPTDYLGIYEIRLDGEFVPRCSIVQKDDMTGWYLSDANFVFTFDPAEGSEIVVEYYNEFDSDAADEAYTTYSVVLPDITIYSALIFAGDHFIDERTDRWEARLTNLVREVQDMADRDAMTGGGLSITPMGGGIV